MPTKSMFYGIVIRMRYDIVIRMCYDDNNQPHFHAFFGEYEVIFNFWNYFME